jgi:hypothetical protein
MNGIYQVTIRGRKLESRDLRRLLARAVAEKRAMDHRLRLFASLRREVLSGSGATVSGSLCIGKVPIR